MLLEAVTPAETFAVAYKDCCRKHVEVASLVG